MDPELVLFLLLWALIRCFDRRLFIAFLVEKHLFVILLFVNILVNHPFDQCQFVPADKFIFLFKIDVLQCLFNNSF